MAGGVKSCDGNLVGRRVKVWCPIEKLFYEGVVSSHSFTGKNLVVYADGVEEIVHPKKDNGKLVEDVVGDQVNRKRYPGHSSSRVIPETDGEELVGCKVKVWRTKSKTFSVGVIASYNHSHKKHLVVYTNGTEEMLDLRKHREPAEDVFADQVKMEHSPARDFSSTYADDDMDAHLHVGKKHKVKGHSFDQTARATSHVLSKDHKTPKLEPDIAPLGSNLSSTPGDDALHNVDGYKIKASVGPTLEAILSRYGDIASRCIFKSTSVRASLLEVICSVVQRLQCHDFEAILSELETIESEVSDVEASKIDVLWLHEHLGKLHKIAAFREKYSELRKTKAKSGILSNAAAVELRERHAELVLAQERFKEAERRVDALRLVGRKIDDDLMEFESEEYFWRRRLDDLL